MSGRTEFVQQYVLRILPNALRRPQEHLVEEANTMFDLIEKASLEATQDELRELKAKGATQCSYCGGINYHKASCKHYDPLRLGARQ